MFAPLISVQILQTVKDYSSLIKCINCAFEFNLELIEAP